MCGTTHENVRRTIEQAEAGQVGRAKPSDRPHNYTDVTGVVATRVASSFGLISAKRLLPVAQADGYAGSARNFRRLVADQKR